MTMSLSTALRNARAQDIVDAIDAGATPGTMEIYTAPRPATGAAITTQTKLGTLTFSQPCGTVEGGVITLNAITGDEAADASNTDPGLWSRVKDGDGDFVIDWDVSAPGGGGDVIINTINIVEGGPISTVGPQTITEGGA
jgi:hypothetical protein